MEKLNEIKALIIDDEIDICFLLAELLKTRKISSSYVTSLAEAKKILESYVPSLIFLDNHLPDGLGINFIRYIKEICPGAHILVITAQDKPSYREKAMANGASCFISKPFTKDIVFESIEEVLAK